MTADQIAAKIQAGLGGKVIKVSVPGDVMRPIILACAEALAGQDLSGPPAPKPEKSEEEIAAEKYVQCSGFFFRLISHGESVQFWLEGLGDESAKRRALVQTIAAILKDYTAPILARHAKEVAEAVAAEREACAKICERWCVVGVAAEIRARKP